MIFHLNLNQLNTTTLSYLAEINKKNSNNDNNNNNSSSIIINEQEHLLPNIQAMDMEHTNEKKHTKVYLMLLILLLIVLCSLTMLQSFSKKLFHKILNHIIFNLLSFSRPLSFLFVRNLFS